MQPQPPYQGQPQYPYQPQPPYQSQPQPSYPGQMQSAYQAQPQYPYQAQAQPQLRYVGFWWRVFAYLIDLIPLMIVAYILELVHTPSTLETLVGYLYFIGLEATCGATLGKLALGLRVRKVDGSPISWREAVIRNLLLSVEGLTLCIVTIITINNSPIRQRWGDRVAGTIVIKI